MAVPTRVAGVPDDVLDPRSTWSDAAAYDRQAARLAGMFADNFARFAESTSDDVLATGPTITSS